MLGPVLYGAIDEKYRERTIQIDTGTIKPFDFNISKKNVNKLMLSGKQAVYDFFNVQLSELSDKEHSKQRQLTYSPKMWAPLDSKDRKSEIASEQNKWSKSSIQPLTPSL